MTPISGDILIVGLTKMGDLVCVGGIDLTHQRPVRLIPPDGRPGWPQPVPFEMLGTYRVSYTPAAAPRKPHLEDAFVTGAPVRQAASIPLTEAIRCCKLWEGHPENLFDCTLRWTDKGSGRVFADNVPDCSTGFWRPSVDLVKDSFESYWVGGRGFMLAGKMYKLKYVGLAPIDEIIPASSLVRVSLARWWTREGSGEPEACWLQLSGWFPKAGSGRKPGASDIPF